MYLPPCKSFLEKKFKGFGKNKAALLWVLNNTYFDQNYYHDFNKDLQQEFEKDDKSNSPTFCLQFFVSYSADGNQF